MAVKWKWLLLILALLPALAVPVRAADQEDVESCIRQILSYYLYYQDRAEAEIAELLGQMEEIDPAQAETWGKIMNQWSWIYNGMEINREVLPDGLPEDDSLCIIVFGLRLNEDGSMRPELLSRLEVALRSAEKYPNAYVLCTGGPTAGLAGVTEGGQMARWMEEQGIDKSRIIQETESLDTAENVRNLQRILSTEYPQIRFVAVVTSDYHVQRSTLMLGTMLLYAEGYEGARTVRILSNAVCEAEGGGAEGMYNQATGIAQIAGVSLDGLDIPQLKEWTAETEAVEPEQTEAAPTEPETTAETAPAAETQITVAPEPETTVAPVEEATEAVPSLRAPAYFLYAAVFTGITAVALILVLLRRLEK